MIFEYVALNITIFFFLAPIHLFPLPLPSFSTKRKLKFDRIRWSPSLPLLAQIPCSGRRFSFLSTSLLFIRPFLIPYRAISSEAFFPQVSGLIILVADSIRLREHCSKRLSNPPTSDKTGKVFRASLSLQSSEIPSRLFVHFPPLSIRTSLLNNSILFSVSYADWQRQQWLRSGDDLGSLSCGLEPVFSWFAWGVFAPSTTRQESRSGGKGEEDRPQDKEAGREGRKEKSADVCEDRSKNEAEMMLL